jgi:ribosomal protein S18 acetylase RimI-like enzyme
MIIERVLESSPEILGALEALIPQLTASKPAPMAAELAAMLQNNASVCLAARESPGGPIVGVGCLGLYHALTGIRAVIEDVVVDRGSRGMGAGEALVRGLLEAAQEAGARGVSLTSNPRRVAANRLYVRIGFALRETNCYYYDLG